MTTAEFRTRTPHDTRYLVGREAGGLAGPSRRYLWGSSSQWNSFGPQRQSELVAEEFVLGAAAGVCLSVLKNLTHALAARFQEHLPGALAAKPGQEADEELVAGEGAVGHVLDGDRAGQLARAVEFQSVSEQEEPDLRAGDGVVAMGDGVDDGFVDDVEIVGGNGCPSSVCCACFDRRPAPEFRLARCRFAAGFSVPPPQIVHHGSQVAIEPSGIFFTNAPDFRDDWIRSHCRHP